MSGFNSVFGALANNAFDSTVNGLVALKYSVQTHNARILYLLLFKAGNTYQVFWGRYLLNYVEMKKGSKALFIEYKSRLFKRVQK